MTGSHHLQPCIPVVWIQRGLALYTGLYGLVLLLPLDTFIVTPTFREVARYFSEPSLGGLLCGLAAGIIIPFAVVRRLILAATAAFWVGMAVLALLGNPSTPAWINFSGAALIAGALAWSRA